MDLSSNVAQTELIAQMKSIASETDHQILVSTVNI